MFKCISVAFLIIFAPPIIKADVGGHDLFTSLAQLEVLWKNEMQIVQVMQDAIEKLDRVSETLKSYVKSHQDLKLDQGPNYDFLGHPVNAYHFVRHVANGWNKVHANVIGNNSLLEDLSKLKERENEKLPDEYDVHGAAFGLVRLKSLYNFKMEPFIKEGVISTTLDNGQVVLSQPSVLRFHSYDLQLMGTEGCNAMFYDCCTDFYQACLDMGVNETDNTQIFFNYTFKPEIIEKNLNMAKRLHDNTLDKEGQRSNLHRCHKLPFDVKLRKKKKFKKKKEHKILLGREFLKKVMSEEDKSDTEVETKNQEELQKDMLCRGKELRPLEEIKSLKCFYGHRNSPWLRLGPFRVEENAIDPYHITIQNLLFEHECDRITEFLGPLLDFPPGRMNRRNPKNDWTMKNCWPNEGQNEYLQKLNRRIEHVSGLRANSYLNYSEPFMCGNYGIGGHYWIHPDAHHASPRFYQPDSTGNRVATILTVLESPQAGGATVWPYAGITVFGKKGSGIFWHNLFTSDMVDRYTMHSACPVLLGQKWIGNKWVGYNAQWDHNFCRQNYDSTFPPLRQFQAI